MRKLNLCIDIDGTVTEPYYWLDKVNEHFNVSVKESDCIYYDIHKIVGIKEEEYMDFHDEFSETLHRESDVRLGAVQVVNRLYRKHNIHFVTARNKDMYDVSIEWLDRYKFPMDSIHLLGSHNKVKKAQELDCDIFIEDRYENAIQLSEEGFDVILIDCNYNKGITPENVYRVKNWYQIERIIGKYTREIDKQII